jgi:hypothetical protein
LSFVLDSKASVHQLHPLTGSMKNSTRMVCLLGDRRSEVGWALCQQPPAAGEAATSPVGWSMAACQARLLGLVVQAGVVLVGQGSDDQVVRLHDDPSVRVCRSRCGRGYRGGVRCQRTKPFDQPFGR